MALKFHPERGMVVICTFDGFREPEMVKRRPVIVISPRMRHRSGLCTVVPLSTTEPQPAQPYHHRITVNPPLPAPYDAVRMWVKADMLYTVGFDRLSMPHFKTSTGRTNIQHVIEGFDLLQIERCILHGIGMSSVADKM